MKKMINKKRLVAIVLSICFLASIFPLNLNAKSYIFVDISASGEETGSYSHPFRSIQDGIDKAQDEGKDVTIRKGTYEENITIRSGVEIYGDDRDEVIIKADKDKWATVVMHDDTKISNVTVKDGRYGILVKENDSAIISDCKIIDNDKDGIKAERASRKNKYKLEIYDNYIAYNGKNGIYSRRRKASVKDNEIYNNDADGVEFEKKSEVSFEDNRIKDNDGVGLRLTIDGSEIWVNKNTFYDNDKQGIEIRTNGGFGFIQIKKNKFYKNDSYGIVRIEAAPFSGVQWNNSLKIIGDNIFWENDRLNVSPIINVY